MYTIVIVSSRVPPDHSGAGKRIYSFFNYLNTKGYNVKLVTNTPLKSDNNTYFVNSLDTTGILRKFNLICNFFIALLKLSYKFLLSKHNNFRKRKCSVWLVSSCPLTFAASFIFYLAGCRIIFQNTLLGSDDPEYRYPGDYLSVKFKLKKLQYRLADVVTSISPALYEISKKYHANSIMIPNPVEVSYTANIMNNDKKRKKNDKKKVLSVGRLHIEKALIL